jgi:hypothetical protein
MFINLFSFPGFRGLQEGYTFLSVSVWHITSSIWWYSPALLISGTHGLRYAWQMEYKSKRFVLRIIKVSSSAFPLYRETEIKACSSSRVVEWEDMRKTSVLAGLQPTSEWEVNLCHCKPGGRATCYCSIASHKLTGQKQFIIFKNFPVAVLLRLLIIFIFLSKFFSISLLFKRHGPPTFMMILTH